METAVQNTASSIVTLYAQPYDIEAKGFYFTSWEDFEAKADKNLNSWGGKVEEYEFQFIDGEGSQELLDRVSLKDFFEIVETWNSDDIKKIDLLAECVGWHYIGKDADEIKGNLDELIVYSDGYSYDCLGMEVMENTDPELYGRLKDLHHYFDFERWMRDLTSGSSAVTFYRDGVYYFVEYLG
jgi:antirestriction protein